MRVLNNKSKTVVVMSPSTGSCPRMIVTKGVKFRDDYHGELRTVPRIVSALGKKV